jgi:hypothetical protein
MRIASVVGILLAAAVSLGAGPAAAASLSAVPAHAVGSALQFSTDGAHYSTVFPGSLFTDVAVLVPGDSQTITFWIRNAADSAGYLRLVMSDVATTNPALADALSLKVDTATTAGAPARLSQASPCWVVAEGDRLESGGTVRVTATLALGDLSDTDGQSARSLFSVRAGLSDATLGSLPPTSCGGPSTAIPVSGPPVDVAMTGSEFPYPLLVAGAGALGAGLFLLVAARRRRQEDA